MFDGCPGRGPYCHGPRTVHIAPRIAAIVRSGIVAGSIAPRVSAPALITSVLSARVSVRIVTDPFLSRDVLERGAGSARGTCWRGPSATCACLCSATGARSRRRVPMLAVAVASHVRPVGRERNEERFAADDRAIDEPVANRLREFIRAVRARFARLERSVWLHAQHVA